MRTFAALLSTLLALASLGATTTAPATRPTRAVQGPGSTFNVQVPAHPLDLILARPTPTSITLSIRTYDDLELRAAYGADAPTQLTEPRLIKKAQPTEILLDHLTPHTAYTVHLLYKQNDQWLKSDPAHFHTARAPGDPFTFTLTADAHLDEHTSPAVYLQTLKNIAADQPDFHIDLGNLFMTDKHTTKAEAIDQYTAQRYYLSQLRAPLFLALGTHDGEAARYDDGTPNCMAVWSHLARTSNFPNPLPNDFYTGNTRELPHRGLPQNYYAFTWGDALFIILDPFANTAQQRGPSKDGWAWTLGRPQYDWLTTTLATSRAPYKFVFIHNLLRGDQSSRGGTEFAAFNEWGGHNPDGTDGFPSHRPSWPLPIHPLLVKHHVSAVFRAHDNFYARQSLDNIAYLMVPQPSFAGNDRIRDLQAYGYRTGTFLGNPGHLRISVSPTATTTHYLHFTRTPSTPIPLDPAAIPPSTP